MGGTPPQAMCSHVYISAVRDSDDRNFFGQWATYIFVFQTLRCKCNILPSSEYAIVKETWKKIATIYFNNVQTQIYFLELRKSSSQTQILNDKKKEYS